MSESNAVTPAVYVYEKPVRLWHGLNALAIVVLSGHRLFNRRAVRIGGR